MSETEEKRGGASRHDRKRPGSRISPGVQDELFSEYIELCRAGTTSLKFAEFVKMKNHPEGKTTDTTMDVDKAKRSKQEDTNDKLGKQTSSFKYSTLDKGPFSVLIRFVDDERKKNLCLLDIARKLSNLLIRYDNIIPTSKNTWKLIFNEREKANACLLNCHLKDHQLETFVPSSMRRKKGVIRQIPLDMNNEEILKVLQEENPECQVSSVNRLKKKVKGKDRKWCESQAVCVTFDSSVLPRSVKMWSTHIQVTSYIPHVCICYNCGLFGHIGSKCDRQKVCLQCGQNHETKEGAICSNPKKCVNCGEEHSTLDPKCPRRAEEMELKSIMVRDNVSFLEAKHSLKTNHSHRYSGESNHNHNHTNAQRPSTFVRSIKDFPKLPGNNQVSSANSNSTSNSPWNRSGLRDQSPIKEGETPSSPQEGELTDDIVSAIQMIFQAISKAPDVNLLIKRILNTIQLHCQHGSKES